MVQLNYFFSSSYFMIYTYKKFGMTKAHVYYDNEHIFFIFPKKLIVLKEFLKKHPGQYKVITTDPCMYLKVGFYPIKQVDFNYFMRNF